MNPASTKKGKVFALIGAFLQLGIVIGITGTFFGLMRASRALEGDNGIANQKQLAETIDEVLIFAAIGTGLCLLGLVFICSALFAFKYRAKWLFWFLVDYGIILLLGYPKGTVVGLVILLFCFLKRREFLTPPKPAIEEAGLAP